MVPTKLALIASGLSLAAMAACGNKVDVMNDGGGSNMCTGHGACPDGGGGSGVNIMSPEGGNLLLENMYLDTDLQAAFKLPAGVTTVARATAYFMDAQTPQANPLPMPKVCTNLDVTHGWPWWIGTPHTDLDVGTVTLKGKNMAGSDVSIDLPKQSAGLDAIGRMHDIFYQAVLPGASDYIMPNSSYDVVLGGGTTGSTTIPATTFTGGLFMSADYTVSAPAHEDNGPMIGGTDFPVHWSTATSSNMPAGDSLYGIAWLVDTNGAPAIMCFTPTQSDDMFTIPGEMINEYKQDAMNRGTDPTHVILLRQAVDHHIVQLPNNEPNNKRRLDLITMNCWAQLMGVQ